MADMLPKLFFDHFTSTSFIAEEGGKTIGFLIGFLSQSHADEAYIHFVGVDPDYRKQHFGRQLYNRFFQTAKEGGRNKVRCVTSPVNRTSIAFHGKMGFEMEAGDRVEDGVPIHTDYDGPGQDRVLFLKKLPF